MVSGSDSLDVLLLIPVLVLVNSGSSLGVWVCWGSDSVVSRGFVVFGGVWS